MSNDTVYGYFTAKINPGKSTKLPNGGLGYCCVRLDRPPKGSSNNNYRASFSFCSPSDAPKKQQDLNWKFKDLAKKIANDRMDTKRVKCYVEFTFDRTEETTLPDLFRVALDVAKRSERLDKNRPVVPEWFLAADDVVYGLSPIPDNKPRFGDSAYVMKLPVSVS